MDIAVAGCGTAGMTAALLLARDGHRITLFERFDRPKPLGSGLMLQPTGLAVLQSLGLAEHAIRHGQKIERLIGKAGGRIVLDVRYSNLSDSSAFAVGIHRSALFTLLYQQLEAAGVSFVTSREVAGCRERKDGISLEFSCGASDGPFALVVDALGTRSSLAPAAGRDLSYGALWANVSLPDSFDHHSLTQRYRRASIMAGVLPIGSAEESVSQAAFFWSLRAKDYRRWLERGIGDWQERVVELWPEASPLVKQIHSAQQLTFARYSHKTLRRPAEGRLIHIGDAWHSASPQLGQGANMAMLDAFALAKGMRAADDVPTALGLAVDYRRGHVRLYQLLTALLTPVYQSDSWLIPLVRDRVMGPASQLWPLTTFQAALVSGLVGSPLRRLGINFAPPQIDS